MGEKLSKPLVVEALCELLFELNESWDWTIPGQFYEKVKDVFPKKHQINKFEISVDPKLTEVSSSSNSPERMQFISSSGDEMLQVGAGVFVYNKLKPYHSWDVFLKQLISTFEAFSGILPNITVKKVGLRYINLVDVKDTNFNIDDFITTGPPLHGVLDKPLLHFFQRYELIYSMPEGVLIHQTTIKNTDASSNSIVVDLDFVSFLNGSEKVRGIQNLRDWLDRAHSKIYEAFEGSINPKLFATLR